MKPLFKIAACLLVVGHVFSLTSAQAQTQVDVYLTASGKLQKSLDLTGTIEPKHRSNVAPLQAGVIDALFFEVGDKVEQGQKLLSLDSTLAKLDVEQAKAVMLAKQTQFKEAERLYQEVVALSKRELVAKTLLNERLAQVELAKAALAEAKATLATAKEIAERHTLYAPFAGVISHRHIDIGEWVSQQTTVLRLVAQKDLRLRVAIPQEYYSQLTNAEGIEVVVVPDFNQVQEIPARLNRIVAVADDQSRSIIGLIDLPSDSSLVSGMSAHAMIALPTQDQTIVWLPKTAIKQHPDGGASVFSVENNRVKRRLVSVVSSQAERVAVTGLSAELQVVISGVELLKDNDTVTVNNKLSGAL
ncbi:efflux RND transporter periplasmic adaptor subunit [Thalassotalea sp. LPB0316]|uniref:efflux RND transporter periplasmic adaptor subunit n=1 Tax=Thalassotalea sp. LPB0316 TaxID=2769490 RepID=UPI001867E2A7|nr:efflux RND transporter periplasmic adaptor subunit [Thalassotalea sp. LPB0316]QOL24821.1 efflux RND transporter periplasmic adaptor subunit [Thalassotalea sp. LPB0316]